MTFFSPEEIARFEAGEIKISLLVKMDFVSQTVGVWNGNTPLTVNGVEYTPLFGAGTIDGLSYTNSTASEQVVVSVSGADMEVLGLAMSEAGEVQDRLMTIFLQFFDDDWQPIAAAPVIFYGYMQPPEGSQDEIAQDLNAGSPVHTISVAAENIYFNRSRAPGGRYSDRDQQQRSPGDKMFDMMPGLVFKTFKYPDF